MFVNSVVKFHPITICEVCLGLLQWLGQSCRMVLCIWSFGTWFVHIGLIDVGFSGFLSEGGIHDESSGSKNGDQAKYHCPVADLPPK